VATIVDPPVPVTTPADPDVAFDELFRRQYAAMVRLAHLLTRSNLAAEDLVQDAFVRVRAAWDRIDEPVPYLRRAVVNACRSWYRGRAREAARDRMAAVPDVAALPPETLEVLDVIRRLPWGQRTALVLRYYAELPEAEIAAAMGCRPGTVKSHLHRGRAAVRKEIGA
jgi:RNA polymerase sigma-70 factor (sigma-E family)